MNYSSWVELKCSVSIGSDFGKDFVHVFEDWKNMIKKPLLRLRHFWITHKFGTYFVLDESVKIKNITLATVKKIVLLKYGILLPKLFWPSVRKNCSSYWETRLKFEAERPRISKLFELTITISLNSERSEQFLETECFFSLFLEVSHI